MSRTHKVQQVEVLGFIGYGDTRKEAREGAERQILEMSQGSWTPVILEWMGDAVLIYRSGFGWEYTFIQRDGGPVGKSSGCTMVSGKFDITRKAAAAALVQSAWKVGMAIDLFPDLFPDFFTDVAARTEQVQYRRKLTEVTTLMQAGYSVNEAIDRAHGYPPVGNPSLTASKVLPQ